MRYKNIKIENFRGIKELSIDNLTKVNVLLGQNGSGKSSILEAIFLLTGFNNAQLALNVDSFRNIGHTEEDDFRFIFHGLDYQRSVKLDADMHQQGGQRKLEIVPFNDTGEKKIAAPGKISNSSSTTVSDTSVSEGDLPQETGSDSVNGLDFKAEVKEYHAPRKTFNSTVSLRQSNMGIEFTVKPDAKRYTSFKALIQPATSRNANDTSKRLEKLLIDKKKDAVISELKKIDRRLTDIIVGRNNMIYADIGVSRLIPTNLMGDGFLKFLEIIVNMYEVKNGVMLIDEIDNGLHFSVLRKLWQVILSTCEEFDIQLFITTHSKEAIMYLKEILNDDSFCRYQPLVKCYTISRLKDNTVKAYDYGFDAFEYAIEHDVEIRGEI